jgi:hypothetical protein
LEHFKAVEERLAPVLLQSILHYVSRSIDLSGSCPPPNIFGRRDGELVNLFQVTDRDTDHGAIYGVIFPERCYITTATVSKIRRSLLINYCYFC